MELDVDVLISLFEKYSSPIKNKFEMGEQESEPASDAGSSSTGGSSSNEPK